MRVLILAAAAALLAAPALAQSGRTYPMGFDFEAADINGDGGLSAEELGARLLKTAGVAGARQMVADLDANGDGRLTPAEMNGGSTRPIAMGMPLLHDFADVDLDHDGGVTLKELHAQTPQRNRWFVDLMFEGNDADKTSVLSEAEWETLRSGVTLSTLEH